MLFLKLKFKSENNEYYNTPAGMVQRPIKDFLFEDGYLKFNTLNDMEITYKISIVDRYNIIECFSVGDNNFVSADPLTAGYWSLIKQPEGKADKYGCFIEDVFGNELFVERININGDWTYTSRLTGIDNRVH